MAKNSKGSKKKGVAKASPNDNASAEQLKELEELTRQQAQLDTVLQHLNAGPNQASLALLTVHGFDLLLSELITEVCFGMHAKAQNGLICSSLCPPECLEHENSYVHAGDIFGNGASATTTVECSICQRKVAASRCAPHLEKCMGLGSSRLASRRANTIGFAERRYKEVDSAGESASHASDVSVEENASSGDAFALPDDDDDDDYQPGRKSAKKKNKKKGNGRVVKTPSNGIRQAQSPPNRKRRDGSRASTQRKKPPTLQAISNMTLKEIANVLRSTCGVVLENGAELCSNPVMKCDRHQESEREAIRSQLLSGIVDNPASKGRR